MRALFPCKQGFANQDSLLHICTVETHTKLNEDKTESKSWDVHVGSAVVRVYFTPSGDRKFYTVSYWVDGKRKRKVLPSLEKAIAEAKSAGGQLTKGDLGSAELSAVQRLACVRAMQLLAPTGVPIEVAAAQFAHAKRLLGKVPLSHAVEVYLKRYPTEIPDHPVTDVIAEMLKAKEDDGLSEGYLKHLRYDLAKFAGTFRGNLGVLVGTDIDAWLRGLEVSPRTRNNLRNSVQTLFGYAKARKYLPKDHDELDAVARAKDGDGEIEVFTPVELVEILNAADESMIPFLALGAFAGVRHAEIQRLDWRDIHFEAGIVEIHAKKAKTASRRTIPLLDSLRAWLLPRRLSHGPVCRYENVANEIDELVRDINRARRAEWAMEKGVAAEALKETEKRARERLANAKAKAKGGRRRHKGEVPAGAETAVEEGWAAFAWKHNALRHSFISYRVAETQDVAKVSLEAGNSPQMIFKHYRELVRPAEAKGCQHGGKTLSKGGTLQACLGALPGSLLFMGKGFSACRREMPQKHEPKGSRSLVRVCRRVRAHVHRASAGSDRHSKVGDSRIRQATRTGNREGVCG